MRALLLGARGMLGHAIAQSAPEGVQVLATSRDELDVVDSNALAFTLDLLRPDIVINASGYTAVDRAENDRAAAFAVNASAVAMLGSASAKRGIPVVHFSTDYVFDGSSSRPYHESDTPHPINCYGESKLEGERRLMSSGALALVVRTQWLFGTGGKSFVSTMWERARRGQATQVVDDQRGRPTSAADLAQATWRLIDRRQFGLLHVANAGHATWYEIATAVFTRLGIPELVTPCRTADIPRPARRPAYSVLDTTRTTWILNSSLAHWSDALGRFLESLPVGEHVDRR